MASNAFHLLDEVIRSQSGMVNGIFHLLSLGVMESTWNVTRCRGKVYEEDGEDVTAQYGKGWTSDDYNFVSSGEMRQV